MLGKHACMFSVIICWIFLISLFLFSISCYKSLMTVVWLWTKRVPFEGEDFTIMGMKFCEPVSRYLSGQTENWCFSLFFLFQGIWKKLPWPKCSHHQKALDSRLEEWSWCQHTRTNVWSCNPVWWHSQCSSITWRCWKSWIWKRVWN